MNVLQKQTQMVADIVGVSVINIELLTINSCKGIKV